MRNGRRQRGFTYLLVLFLVVALGIGAAQIGVVWQQAVQREREIELLYRASDIAKAIGRYQSRTPVGTRKHPQSLDELIEDRRFPVPVRHLRRVWRDPFTGEPDWVLVRTGEAIVGLHSRAKGSPIRTHGLPPELGPEAGGAARYSDWVFRPDIKTAPAAEESKAASAAKD
ncbi:type II secretion system protein [Thauera sinica]|uniref:Type II secretion system protein n=1 Tax=Thauera sinica TaxID=2665146 RepID=A0ABW1ANK9_9RHOO|nr:type II secretion system protein [Thauera sp. K11]